MEDTEVIQHIEALVAEEEQLYSKGELTEDEIKRLHKLKVQLDQYWDFLRQRRAFRNAGENPDQAEIRSAKTVENYKQ